MLKCIRYSMCVVGFLASTSTLADITIPMYLTAKQGLGESIGNVTAKQTPKGMLLTPDLYNLPPGPHGFHIHQNPSCLDNGMAAGGHFDPKHTDRHLGPYGKGHLGDLPVLEVDKNGKATTPVLAPRLQEQALKNHSLVIHAGSDNYSDSPKPLGGGNSRVACGVIE
jgi:Cu-Zn family superoxide dismutase